MSLTGNFIDAATACNWRLVNRVVPQDRLLPETMQLAHDIASADPKMTKTYKSLIDEGSAQNLVEHARSIEA